MESKNQIIDNFEYSSANDECYCLGQITNESLMFLYIFYLLQFLFL